ncbi:MAG: transposase, partial [Clostridia bacterium]|nr:transposase [Clostridia bacterium]
MLIDLSGGQVSDHTPAIDLMNLFDRKDCYVLADKGYD